MRRAWKHCTWQLTRLKPRAPTIITVCTLHFQTCHSLEASSCVLLHTSYQLLVQFSACRVTLHEHSDWEIYTNILSTLILGWGHEQALVAEATWPQGWMHTFRTRQLSRGHGILSLCVCVCPFCSGVDIYGREPRSQSVRWGSALLTVSWVSLG